MPPDRLEAPSPGARASSTTTDRPARASVNAADNPAYPEPIIATSQRFGSVPWIGDSRGAASHQYGSWESGPDSVRIFSSLFALVRQLYDHWARTAHLDPRKKRAPPRRQRHSTT